MVNERDIQLAITDLESQETPNYTATVKKYNIHHTTLMHRYKCQTTSRQESTSIYRKLLTNAQEEVVLGHINRLTDRGISPTPKILGNILEEIVKQLIRQN